MYLQLLQILTMQEFYFFKEWSMTALTWQFCTFYNNTHPQWWIGHKKTFNLALHHFVCIYCICFCDAWWAVAQYAPNKHNKNSSPSIKEKWRKLRIGTQSWRLFGNMLVMVLDRCTAVQWCTLRGPGVCRRNFKSSCIKILTSNRNMDT